MSYKNAKNKQIFKRRLNSILQTAEDNRLEHFVAATNEFSEEEIHNRLTNITSEEILDERHLDGVFGKFLTANAKANATAFHLRQFETIDEMMEEATELFWSIRRVDNDSRDNYFEILDAITRKYIEAYMMLSAFVKGADKALVNFVLSHGEFWSLRNFIELDGEIGNDTRFWQEFDDTRSSIFKSCLDFYMNRYLNDAVIYKFYPNLPTEINGGTVTWHDYTRVAYYENLMCGLDFNALYINSVLEGNCCSLTDYRNLRRILRLTRARS